MLKKIISVLEKILDRSDAILIGFFASLLGVIIGELIHVSTMLCKLLTLMNH